MSSKVFSLIKSLKDSLSSSFILQFSQSSSMVSSDVESLDLNENFFCFSSVLVDLKTKLSKFSAVVKGYEV